MGHTKKQLVRVAFELRVPAHWNADQVLKQVVAGLKYRLAELEDTVINTKVSVVFVDEVRDE